MARESFSLKLCILKRKIVDTSEPCSFNVRCTGCPELVDLRVHIQEEKTFRAIHVEGRKVISEKFFSKEGRRFLGIR